MKSVLSEWELRCATHPDHPVVVEGDRSVTGAEFAASARDLAAELAELGVRAGDRVALAIEPSTDLLLCVVATWLAGASFVPLSPTDHSARSDTILAASGPRLVVKSETAATRSAMAPIVEIRGARVISVQSPPARGAIGRGNPDEAYVIFTSGSTGRPKGVAVSHQALWTYAGEARRIYRIDDVRPTVPLHLPATFDAALTSIVAPLITRAVATVVNDPTSQTRGLARALDRASGPVMVKLTPGHVRLLEQLVAPTTIARLRGQFVIGGEALRYEDIAWLRDTGIGIFNEYGPTEATVGCVIHKVAAAEPSTGPVPIGRPHRGVTISVLDDSDTTEAAGGTGELVLSGPCLADGYIDGLPGGFGVVDGRRCYRTGDRVRIDDSGTLHYSGRIDEQLKVNGFRIEPGEVETALRTASVATAAAVITDNDTLIGFIESSGHYRMDEIVAAMRELLPAFMQPSAIHVVDQIPLNAHGKVDRRKLAKQLTGNNEQPRSTLDPKWRSVIEEAWADATGTPGTEPGDSFFTYGDSMAALRFTGRLSKLLSRAVPASMIFDNPTLEGFLDAVGDYAPDLAPQSEPTPNVRTVTPWQRAILHADHLAREPGTYTVLDAVTVTGIHNWAAVRHAFIHTVQRHPVFAQRLHRDSTGSYSATATAPTEEQIAERFELIDDTSAAEVRKLLATLRSNNVDLAEPNASVPRLLVLPAEDHQDRSRRVCVLIAHHAFVDEHSTRLLWHEIFSRARQLPFDSTGDFETWARGHSNPTAAAAARDRADELTEHLFSAPLHRTDLGSFVSRTAATATYDITVPAELAHLICATAARSGTTVAAICGAAATYALGTSLGIARFAVFMPMSLRRDDTDFATVGCMVASVPVLAQLPESDEPPSEFVARWHRSVGFSAQRAATDPAELTDALLSRDPDWGTSARISLAFEQPHSGQVGSVGWEAIPVPDVAKYDLSIHLRADRGPRTGAGRIIYRLPHPDSADTEPIVTLVSRRYIDALTRICLDQVLDPAYSTSAVVPSNSLALGAVTVAASGQELSAALAGLASTVLGRPIGPDDDLIDAGARSLELVALATMITRDLGYRVSAVDLLDHCTSAALASALRMLPAPPPVR